MVADAAIADATISVRCYYTRRLQWPLRRLRIRSRRNRSHRHYPDRPRRAGPHGAVV